MTTNFKDVNHSYETYYMPSKWTRKLTEDQVIPHFLTVLTNENKNIEQLFKSQFNVPYGSTEKEKIDFFFPINKNEILEGEEVPIVVFLHGGYWMEGDRSFYHCIARPYHNQRCIVAVVGYQLAKESDNASPAVKVPDIEEQCVKAVEFINQKFPRSQMILVGHSAGAFLAASLFSRRHLVPFINSVVAISGVYDLHDLTKTSVSKVLCTKRMDEQNLFLRKFVTHEENADDIHREGNKFFIFVGQDDTPMFHWQSMKFYEKLSLENINVSLEIVKDEDHFSVVENLLLESSPITQCIFNRLQGLLCTKSESIKFVD